MVGCVKRNTIGIDAGDSCKTAASLLLSYPALELNLTLT